MRRVLGVLAISLGILLALRPFTSLAALLVCIAVALVANGVTHLLRADDEHRWQRWLAAGFVAGGVAVLAVPGLTVGALVVLAAVFLAVTGVLKIIRGSVLLGVANLILGVLAITWPDVTVLVLAALFGVQLVLLGLELLWPGRRDKERSRSRVRPVLAVFGTGGLLVLSLMLSPTPRPDSFYTAPADVPDAPGQLLAAEPFTRGIPEFATAWRILHTTTLDDGVPAVASALVVVPPGADGVVAWAHGTTGQATGCAPSLLEDPFGAGAFPALGDTLDRGWAVVATDYPGLGTAGSHAYLVGQPAGRAVLDAVRAANQLTGADLPSRTVIWGHSQGGHAALWAGGLAADYAPELDIRGVAAMAPAANLPVLLDELSTSPIGGVFGSFVISAYAEQYDDVAFNSYVRPGARIAVQEMAGRCLTDPSTLVSVATSLLGDKPVWNNNPARGPLLERASENVPTRPIEAPLLVAQGLADTLVTPGAQEQWVAERRAAGQEVDLRGYEGLDHMGLVTEGSAFLPDLVEWTEGALSGGR